jgi:hypothetical protein
MNAEKENMWRNLQGLKPIQSWRCKLNFHKWTNYEVVEPRNDFSMRMYAKCYCADCGMPRIENPFTKSMKNNG